MSGLALDHIMFFCAPGAPEADALLGRGLHEGPGNSHPGQGTINRRFFFRNLYLELLWVDDFDEAQAPEARRTGLWDRWINRHNGSCPLGLVFRPEPNSSPGHSPAPFASWSYVPKYFPAGFSIEVACDIPSNEPLLFYLPFARPALVEDVAPMPGGARIGSVRGTTLHLPDTASLSPALNSLVAQRVVSVEPAQQLVVDIQHEQGSREIIDLRPKLPLRFLPAGEKLLAPH